MDSPKTSGSDASTTPKTTSNQSGGACSSTCSQSDDSTWSQCSSCTDEVGQRCKNKCRYGNHCKLLKEGTCLKCHKHKDTRSKQQRTLDQIRDLKDSWPKERGTTWPKEWNEAWRQARSAFVALEKQGGQDKQDALQGRLEVLKQVKADLEKLESEKCDEDERKVRLLEVSELAIQKASENIQQKRQRRVSSVQSEIANPWPQDRANAYCIANGIPGNAASSDAMSTSNALQPFAPSIISSQYAVHQQCPSFMVGPVPCQQHCATYVFVLPASCQQPCVVYQ